MSGPMEGQTAIPVPAPPDRLGPCAWCGAPAVGEIELERARGGTRRGQSYQRLARKAPVCLHHQMNLELKGDD